MISPRITGILVAALFLVLTPALATASETKLLPKVEVDDDGLQRQPWFADSFLNLREDLTEAAENGKRLVIAWEQRGCPYCKRVHDVNFRIPRLVDYIKKNFVLVQLNLWGDREVVDVDGEVMPEKKMAAKYGIRYTPTFQFFPESLEKLKGKKGIEAEVHRMMGYFYPYHFLTTFEFVFDRAYEKEPNLQRYLIDKGRALQEKGIKIDLMADILPDVPKESAKK